MQNRKFLILFVVVSFLNNCLFGHQNCQLPVTQQNFPSNDPIVMSCLTDSKKINQEALFNQIVAHIAEHQKNNQRFLVEAVGACAVCAVLGGLLMVVLCDSMGMDMSGDIANALTPDVGL